MAWTLARPSPWPSPGRIRAWPSRWNGWNRRSGSSDGITGPVIPSDEPERLFQPFQRLGQARIRPGDGHGLGLASVHAIATAHGAAVTAAARPAGGLDIEVSFP